MRELALRLGHSLLFPTLCRHCSKPIWLFANPDGGFAIFDEPGKPWPKHMCGLIEATTSEYRSEHTFGTRRVLPVPTSSTEGVLSDQQRVQGTVVATQGDRAEIFDGKSRYWAKPSIEVRVGQAVKGFICYENGVPHFILSVVTPPNQEALQAIEEAGLEAEGVELDLEAHKQRMELAQSFFGMNVRKVWGVFSNRNRLVRTYAHNCEAEAKQYAAQIGQERKTTYFVQPLKIRLEE